jgi:hypothetical protein
VPERISAMVVCVIVAGLMRGVGISMHGRSHHLTGGNATASGLSLDSDGLPLLPRLEPVLVHRLDDGQWRTAQQHT